MKLFFYIFVDFFKFVIGILLLCVFLFVLFDFIHKSGNYFPKYEPSTATMIKFYLLQVPSMIAQAIPIAALLGSVITMVLLSRTNEITAMRAVGMSPLQIGIPLAVGGMILTIFTFFIGEYVTPISSAQLHYLQEVVIEGDDSEQIGEGARWVRDEDRLFNFEDYDPVTRTLMGIRLIDLHDNFRPHRSFGGQMAVYDEETTEWVISQIKILHFNRDGSLSDVEYRESSLMPLPVEPKKLKKDWRNTNEMSLGEIREEIGRRERSGADIQQHRVEYHLKWAYPFAAFVVSFIGLRFGYKSERATETVLGVLLAFSIGILYWVILSSTRALGLNGKLPAPLAAWAANLVVLSIVMIDALRARRGT